MEKLVCKAPDCSNVVRLKTHWSRQVYCRRGCQERMARLSRIEKASVRLRQRIKQIKGLEQ